MQIIKPNFRQESVWDFPRPPKVESTHKQIYFTESLIADTKRGKGLPSIEARADRWFVNFTGEEVEMLMKELHGEEEAKLTSETIVAR